nr:MAG TPA: hypothetical protein [Caudoviricetes sp.]
MNNLSDFRLVMVREHLKTQKGDNPSNRNQCRVNYL